MQITAEKYRLRFHWLRWDYKIVDFNIFIAGMEDNGTLGWLIEFGLIKQNQRTEQSKQIKGYGSRLSLLY